MIELKTTGEIERMHVAGQFVAHVLTELAGRAEVGVNLLDLEHHARRMLAERGADSCYWDYAPSFGRGPFRNVICLSVNDAVLHGLPHDYTLCDGDVLSMDLALGINGWVADSALTIIVGTPASSAPRPRRTYSSSEPARKPSKPPSPPRSRATVSVTFRPRSAPWPRGTATRSTSSSAATGSGGPCTRIPTYPTTAVPGAAFACAPA